MEEGFLFENTFTVRQSDAADESDSNTESDTSGGTAGAAGTAPATGDMNQVWLWILMMAVSLSAVVIAERLRRRE